MWQSVVVLFVIALVSIYVARHYLRVYRSDSTACSSCSCCCDVKPGGGKGITGSEEPCDQA